MTETKKINSVIGLAKNEKRAINTSITPPIVPRNYKMLKTLL